MNKLILSLLLLTVILSFQNENDGTKNNSKSNDKSLDENHELKSIEDSIQKIEFKPKTV